MLSRVKIRWAGLKVYFFIGHPLRPLGRGGCQSILDKKHPVNKIIL